jgi:hypothetical protein
MTHNLETVGEILGDTKPAAPEPPKPLGPFTPEVLPGTPELPRPGIYFGMDEETYHALPALSSSGAKKMAASQTIFWASTAWLSARKRRKAEEKTDDQKTHQIVGKAYHCRIMEGPVEFAKRFVVELKPEDHPDALVTTDQIKAAIAVAANPEAGEKPWSKVEDTLPDGTSYKRAAKKEDWVKQLLMANPSAEIFSEIEREFLAEHDGKQHISADDWERIEIAAAMIERDPQVRHAFTGGHPEVTLIWHCPVTGVPMKARVDYLKVKAMVDLKTFANQRESSPDRAINWEISGYKYNMQPAVYEEGVREVKALIRKHGLGVIHDCDDPTTAEAEARQNFAFKWAKHDGPIEWLWVFQQKGDAPITRGKFYPLAGTTHMITKDCLLSAKRKFRTCSEAYGTDIWLDVAPIDDIVDEEIMRATDF